MNKCMVFALAFLVGQTLPAQVASGQAAPHQRAPFPGFAAMGHGPEGMGLGMHPGKVIAGQPFSADVNTSVTQTLSDGNTINRVSDGHMARDGQGRTYFQHNISGGLWAQKGSTTITFLSDPVAGYSYVLNPNTKVAMRRPLRPARNTDASAEHPQQGRSFEHDGKDRVESDLGSQTISGVPATGKSIMHTVPAGSIGNAQPIVSKTEVWTSPDLQVVVLSKRTDPRSGESTYSLNNIHRGEPSATLFQVPSDYSVQDAPSHRHR